MKKTKLLIIGLSLMLAMFITAVAFSSHSLSRQNALDDQQNNSQQNTNTGNRRRRGNRNSNMSNMNMNSNMNMEPNTNGTPR